MLIEIFTVGMLSTNCYVVSNPETREAIVIDPGIDLPSEANLIFDYIEKEALKIKFIVNTHGHSDHIRGNDIFQKTYQVPVCIHSYDLSFIKSLEGPLANVLLMDQSPVQFGKETIMVMHTPGHTPGSICLLGGKIIFTGDTLFAGGIGRTDFPGGSNANMRLSLKKLVRLSDHLLVYPGHGPTSLIGHEKRSNPFLIHLS
jgi:hydroxyacylglutathione hydrolase